MASIGVYLRLIDLETEEGIMFAGKSRWGPFTKAYNQPSDNDLFRTLLHQLMTAQIRVHGLDLPEPEIATQG